MPEISQNRCKVCKWSLHFTTVFSFSVFSPIQRLPPAQFKALFLFQLHVTQTQSKAMGKFSSQLGSLLGQIGQIFLLCGRIHASVLPWQPQKREWTIQTALHYGLGGCSIQDTWLSQQLPVCLHFTASLRYQLVMGTRRLIVQHGLNSDYWQHWTEKARRWQKNLTMYSNEKHDG